MTKQKKPKLSDYCKKQDLLEELKKFKKTNIISEKLGKMFLDIATHYIRYNFRFLKYLTDQDDFIGDAVLRMCSQVEKFDINHPKANAFAYFTTIVHNSTIAAIKKNIKLWAFRHNLSSITLHELEHYGLFHSDEQEIMVEKT